MKQKTSGSLILYMFAGMDWINLSLTGNFTENQYKVIVTNYLYSTVRNDQFQDNIMSIICYDLVSHQISTQFVWDSYGPMGVFGLVSSCWPITKILC